jgi:hypothetical protein
MVLREFDDFVIRTRKPFLKICDLTAPDIVTEVTRDKFVVPRESWLAVNTMSGSPGRDSINDTSNPS